MPVTCTEENCNGKAVLKRPKTVSSKLIFKNLIFWERINILLLVGKSGSVFRREEDTWRRYLSIIAFTKFNILTKYSIETNKCVALRDLVPFVQLKKLWKTPMDECYF